jgi:spermidine synthase
VRRRWGAAAVPAVILAAAALPLGTIKGSDDARVIDEVETTYQYARVIEEDNGERRLELNEGLAVHSLYRPGSYLTGDYWDGFLVLPLAVGSQAPRKVAILGNAAGTTARAMGRFFGATRVDAVEIDPKLTRLGRRWFHLRNPRMTVFHEDARPFLRRSDGGYDAIFVDVYRQPYIPFYLATREFFDLARERLRPGGSVVINVGHPEGQEKLEKVLTATLGAAFANVARDPIEDTNTLLIASEAPISGAALGRATGGLSPELRPVARAEKARLEAPLDGGSVYTDDRAPVEWLIDRSIVDYAAHGQ